MRIRLDQPEALGMEAIITTEDNAPFDFKGPAAARKAGRRHGENMLARNKACSYRRSGGYSG